MFRVNGQDVSCEGSMSLLRFLRDVLHLHSVKDGCSQGACGTCTVLVNDKAVKACVRKTDQLEGAEVTTLEGLSREEKEAFVRAFSFSGAVQCGFCIPGMVMAAAALLRQNPSPTEEEVRKALRGNICRCTGYRKIVDGVLLAASILRKETTPDIREASAGVGQSSEKVDAEEKILGSGEYVDDMEIPGLCLASAVRSPFPRCRLRSIDASRALLLPGVLAVLTAEDVPHNKVGHIQQDWDVMIATGDITRSCGDALCVVVAEDSETLEEAKKLIALDLEELPPVSSIKQASAPDAPKIHESGNLCQSRHVSRGDADKAFAEAACVVSSDFSTPMTEHAFLEPECAIAISSEEGISVFSSDQSVYDTRREIAIMFGWPEERIVVENKLVGGGFGGKEDVSAQHLAALAAWKTGKPVKMRFSRDESLAFHPKRHAMEGSFALACDENGIFTGLRAEIHFDTGAYASLCGPVLERACTHAVGPYHYHNTDIKGWGWYTNNPPAGAFRGFGVCQSEFALEMLIDQMAVKMGIDPWEIRYRNAIRPGEELPNGQIADASTALVECLERVKPAYDANRGHCGLACAMKNTGVGVGLPDKGRARLEVKNGRVEIYTAASDIGQGCSTVFLQMLQEITGLPSDKISKMPNNSSTSPDSGTTSGSRQTLVSGEAVVMAARELKTALDEAGSMEALEGRIFEAEFFEPTDKLGAEVEHPRSHIAYGYAVHLAILDPESRKLIRVVAAHDSGRVINPKMMEGQIEGGVVMGMGYALREDLQVVDSRVRARFGTLGLFRADEVPEIEVHCVEKEDYLPWALGSKGVGEIASIPTAPAIGGAYYALDGVFRTRLPLEGTPYRKK